MKIFIEFLLHSLLCVPILFEIFDDKKGDKHNSYKDLFYRSVFIAGSASIAYAFNFLFNYDRHHIIQYIVLSTGLFFMLFDYLVACFLYIYGVINNSKWWEVLNNKSFPDNWGPWISIGWKGRLAVRILFLVLCEIYYWR